MNKPGMHLVQDSGDIKPDNFNPCTSYEI